MPEQRSLIPMDYQAIFFEPQKSAGTCTGLGLLAQKVSGQKSPVQDGFQVPLRVRGENLLQGQGSEFSATGSTALPHEKTDSSGLEVAVDEVGPGIALGRHNPDGRPESGGPE